MRENYVSIQYLRAFAALLVVLHHARNPHTWLYNPLENFNGFARGVDIFFVISGFIMAAIATRDSPSDFARKRVIRVAPIYWMTTTAAALLAIRKAGVDQNFLERLVLSLLFIPHTNPDGEVFPILPPGWTLNYEMFFYALFFLCLWSKHPIKYCFSTLLALVLIGSIIQTNSPITSTYTSPLLTEFSSGLLIGHFRKNIVSQQKLALSAIIGSALLFASTHWSMSAAGASMIVVGTLALESKIRTVKIFKELGDASYFTYLSHHFIIGITLKIWQQLPISGPLQIGTMMAACLILSSATGLMGHRIIEKPLTKWLNKITKTKTLPSSNENPSSRTT